MDQKTEIPQKLAQEVQKRRKDWKESVSLARLLALLTPNSYRKLYLGAKGNQFKNKRVVVEAIWKQKAEKLRVEKIEAEQQARRSKNAETRRRKLQRKRERDGK